MRVGIIGMGAVGHGIVDLLSRIEAVDVELIGALVRQKRDHGSQILMFTRLDDLLQAGPEVMVEAAGHQALGQHGPAVLHRGIDLIMTSIGALANPELEDAIREGVISGSANARIASGAIGALDALAAASIGGLDNVTQTTLKPAASLLGSEKGAELVGPKELFRGSAREGALKFPESTNVAAAVGLSGIGLDRTGLVVVADPAVGVNTHAVEARGTFGTLRFEIRNVPSERNPRSAKLVAMSVVNQLLNRRSGIRIG